ncbi:MAG: DUF2318 domain-containing protein [Syntrophobacterales bacterium]|jgi:uncharacterized membrane protein
MSKKKRKKNSGAEKSASKKEIVLNTEKQSQSPFRTLAVIAVVVGAGLAFYLFQNGFGNNPQARTPSIQPEVTATEVSFPIQALSDGKAKYFQYPTGNGITVRFFILRSSDGVIRAAYDACDVCWREGKGYYQDGDYMVCRNCGQRFASVKVNEIKGGCNPAPLERTVVGNKLVIKTADILQGARYFNFSGRS